MNLVVMMGRATKDPEVRYGNNICVANMDIAVNRRFKKEGQPDADFFRCTAFGKTGEFIEKYIRKGTKIVIQGEVRNDNYEKGGVKHYGTRIIINQIEFAESKKAEEKTEFAPIPEGMEEELPFC